MERSTLIGLVEAVADLAVASADRAAVEQALAEAEQVRRWLAAKRLELHRRLRQVASWPEHADAQATGHDLAHAEKAAEHTAVLAGAAAFARALGEGLIAPEHVEILARALKASSEHARARVLQGEGQHALQLALRATPAQFAKRLRAAIERLERGGAVSTLDRQRRAIRLRAWIDPVTGMYRFSGQLDPLTGMVLDSRIAANLDALFRDGGDTAAPSDPGERHDHLRARALLQLLGISATGEATSAVAAPTGRPEMVVVVDTSTNEHGIATVDWGLPIELPPEVVERLLRHARARAVLVRDGTIVHAPGRLDLGRERRLANHDQRAALRALYATCAMPGCAVRYDHTKLHHVTVWERGGPTDLENLLPLCERHHQSVHQRGWRLHLAPDRSLTITMPDRTAVSTGPPSRAA